MKAELIFRVGSKIQTKTEIIKWELCPQKPSEINVIALTGINISPTILTTHYATTNRPTTIATTNYERRLLM